MKYYKQLLASLLKLFEQAQFGKMEFNSDKLTGSPGRPMWIAAILELP